MQSTGHSSTHARSLTSMQGSAITNVMVPEYPLPRSRKRWKTGCGGLCPISVFGRVDERSGSVLFVAVRAVILTVRTLVLSALVALVVSALVALVISALVALVVVALAAAVVALAAAVVALAAAVVALAAAVVALAAAVVA